MFKGSGFYRTDSRGKPAKADGAGDKAKKPGRHRRGLELHGLVLGRREFRLDAQGGREERLSVSS